MLLAKCRNDVPIGGLKVYKPQGDAIAESLPPSLCCHLESSVGNKNPRKRSRSRARDVNLGFCREMETPFNQAFTHYCMGKFDGAILCN